jgi:predicted nucleic acid-binding protein
MAPAGVTDVVCLDAGVWVKTLVDEELSEQAANLLAVAIANSRIVAPAFCWAEVGSVLRKKVRAEQITSEEAIAAWDDFHGVDVMFLDTPAIRSRAWELAESLAQHTLYDLAYLACTELALGTSRSFWTADDELLRALGDQRPEYVHHLRDAAHVPQTSPE